MSAPHWIDEWLIIFDTTARSAPLLISDEARKYRQVVQPRRGDSSPWRRASRRKVLVTCSGLGRVGRLRG